MTSLDWTQVALFAAGAVGHFLYARFVGNGAAPKPLASDAVNVLTSIIDRLIDSQAPAAPSSDAPQPDTSAELLALLHKVIDQKAPATPAVPQTHAPG